MTTARPKPDYKVIGTRPIRHDGVDKVTGRAVYGADVQLPGLLHGRILRSPHAHARIRRIDASQGRWRCPASRRSSPRPTCPTPATASPSWAKAPINLRPPEQQLPGARQGALPRPRRRRRRRRSARTSPRRRCELIEVEYEALPPVLDVREAMKRRRAAPARRPASPSRSASRPASRPTSPSTSSSSSATSRRASPRPTSSSSASSTPRRSTRATSSRTTPPPCGTPTAR